METYHIVYFDQHQESVVGDFNSVREAAGKYLEAWMQRRDYICWYKNSDKSYTAVVCTPQGEDTDATCVVVCN